MKFIEASIPGIILIGPDVFDDNRGFFLETYHREKYSAHGIDRVFVQDNLSHSQKGTLRGLHYQLRNPQAKLIYVLRGEVFDVAVDIRRGSPTFGHWTGTHLSAENKRQVFVPEGFAHGFCVLSQAVDLAYKCTDFYTPGDEYGVLWSDPAMDIQWPVDRPILSARDQQNPELKAIPEDLLPVHDPGARG
jgi:dTDP-4-dehydrorhamnose 3,5-epimerase